MISIICKVPLYWSFGRFGFPRVLPFSLTISVTSKCNSRCLTCNIWTKAVDRPRELTVEEYKKLFEGIGPSLKYITYSGGEPFLRKDFAEIAALGSRICRPSVITIPSNGLLTEKVVSDLGAVSAASPHSEIFVNLSLDGVGEDHDRIRGVPGCFDKVTSTYSRLRSLALPNVAVGFHTVISRFNVDNIERIYRFAEEMGADSFAAELAEQRVELGTTASDIAPPVDALAGALGFLKDRAADRKEGGFKGLKLKIRRSYYDYVLKVAQGQAGGLTCYAGIASGQVMPDGDVWFCCMKGEAVGNIRDAGYDFRRVWFSAEADRLRRLIKSRRCYCPLANAYYTNYLLNMHK